MNLAPLAKRLGIISAFLFAAVFPVGLYDHLVAKRLLEESRRRPAQAPSPQQVADDFHILFYSQPYTWYSNKWLGVTTWQNPNDVWIIQEILSEVVPDFVVECGAAWGGGALIWATLLEQINPRAQVITIDIKHAVQQASAWPIWTRRVQFILGSSTAPETVAEVTRRVRGGRTLVILDSDHSKSHVLKELDAYSPLVSVGSYLIVQDSNIHGHPAFKEFEPGPMEAIDEWLPANGQFESDRSRERLILTFSPKGYLKRVR